MNRAQPTTNTSPLVNPCVGEGRPSVPRSEGVDDVTQHRCGKEEGGMEGGSSVVYKVSECLLSSIERIYIEINDHPSFDRV